jgi:hypothetical protein
MSSTFTTTFTRTHAREIASRVAADLKLMQRFYGRPSDADIDDYEEEFVELLVGGHLRTLEYGFKRHGERIVSLRYTVAPGSRNADRAGGVYALADVGGANFFSFLEYSSAFDALSLTEQAAVKAGLPVQRSAGTAPGDGNGYWVDDRGYAAGGVAANRATFRPAA